MITVETTRRTARSLVLAAVLAASAWAISPARPTLACTEPVGGVPPYTVADRVTAAPIVLHGIVKAIDGDQWQVTYGATVEVVRYFKGQGEATVHIDGYGSSALCLVEVLEGEQHVFYVWRNPDGSYSAHYLSQGDAVDPATPEILAKVRIVMEYYKVRLPSLLRISAPADATGPDAGFRRLAFQLHPR